MFETVAHFPIRSTSITVECLHPIVFLPLLRTQMHVLGSHLSILVHIVFVWRRTYTGWLRFRFWEHIQVVHACFVMSNHYCGFDKSIDDITHAYVIWLVISFFVPIQCLLRLLCSFVLASVVAVIVAVRWSDLTSTIRLFNSLLASVQTSLPIRCVNMQTMLCTCCFLVRIFARKSLMLVPLT